MTPLFIVLDGPDATGTTTHAEFLAQRLEKEGRPVMLTSEPTNGPIGRRIREYLSSGEADPLELQMLFTQDRAWHVENVIRPALEAGNTIVCDRYWYSTVVYAEAQDLDATEIRRLNAKFIRPSAVIFTMPPFEVSLKRIQKRVNREIFEREDLQRKVHAGYARMAQEDPQIRTVDTSGTKEAAAETIWKIIEPLL